MERELMLPSRFCDCLGPLIINQDDRNVSQTKHYINDYCNSTIL
jgi:hypothetical protein